MRRLALAFAFLLLPVLAWADAVKGTFAVPASAVAKAIAKRDVGAEDAKDSAGKPIGAKLRGVGKYGVGLKDGDIVTSVAGTRTTSVSAMVAAGLKAAEGHPKALRGTVKRGEDTYAVVIELPQE